MADHQAEENRVEPWEWAVEPSDETPSQGEEEIASVVNLAGKSICKSRIRLVSPILLCGKGKLTPPINQDRAILSFDSLGVLHGLPWQLREGFSQNHASTLLLTESVLLTVCGIPHPVDEKVQSVQTSEGVSVPLVGRWVMVGKVDGAVAVAQGHASQVPEDEHEPPFLEIHVPRAVLACYLIPFKNDGIRTTS